MTTEDLIKLLRMCADGNYLAASPKLVKAAADRLEDRDRQVNRMISDEYSTLDYELVDRLRNRIGISRRKLAMECGIRDRTFSMWFSRRTRVVPGVYVRRIMDYLYTHVDQQNNGTGSDENGPDQ